jgi:hypothetical protein
MIQTTIHAIGGDLPMPWPYHGTGAVPVVLAGFPRGK